MNDYLAKLRAKGHCPPRKPLKKILWSWLGAFLGIFLVAVLAELYDLAEQGKLFLLGSFGASAVLIYGAPQADFSQPRNLVGGHLISALVGVSLTHFTQLPVLLAAPLAVSLAIALMHLSRTLHPPGGATALIAVIGGERIHQLGFAYLVPVLGGSLLLLLVALLVNNLSSNPRRHYPHYWF